MVFFTNQDQLQFVQSTNEIQGYLNTAVPFSPRKKYAVRRIRLDGVHVGIFRKNRLQTVNCHVNCYSVNIYNPSLFLNNPNVFFKTLLQRKHPNLLIPWLSYRFFTSPPDSELKYPLKTQLVEASQVFKPDFLLWSISRCRNKTLSV